MTTANVEMNTNPFRAISLIVRGVWIESIRQKDVLALAVLMGIYFLGVSVIRMVGIDDPATGTFIYNLGLTLTGYCAHVVALLSAGRQIPDEIENRTIYPILAKPISRNSFLIGKWLAATSFGWMVIVSLALLVYVMTPKLESYDALMGWQALGASLFSLAIITAWSVFLSLLFPKPMTYALVGIWFFTGDKVVGFVSGSISSDGRHGVLSWICEYLPDFSRLNLWTRYTDGIEALSVGTWMGVVFYGFLFASVPLMIAEIVFRRKPL